MKKKTKEEDGNGVMIRRECGNKVPWCVIPSTGSRPKGTLVLYDRFALSNWLDALGSQQIIPEATNTK